MANRASTSLWEATKKALIRSFFEDNPSLVSPENYDHTQDQPMLEKPSSDEDSLPPLVVEIVKPPNKHDDSEEFYEDLERKIHVVCRQLFIEKRSMYDLTADNLDWLSLSDNAHIQTTSKTNDALRGGFVKASEIDESANVVNNEVIMTDVEEYLTDKTAVDKETNEENNANRSLCEYFRIQDAKLGSDVQINVNKEVFSILEDTCNINEDSDIQKEDFFVNKDESYVEIDNFNNVASDMPSINDDIKVMEDCTHDNTTVGEDNFSEVDSDINADDNNTNVEAKQENIIEQALHIDADDNSINEEGTRKEVEGIVENEEYYVIEIVDDKDKNIILDPEDNNISIYGHIEAKNDAAVEECAFREAEDLVIEDDAYTKFDEDINEKNTDAEAEKNCNVESAHDETLNEEDAQLLAEETLNDNHDEFDENLNEENAHVQFEESLNEENACIETKDVHIEAEESINDVYAQIEMNKENADIEYENNLINKEDANTAYKEKVIRKNVISEENGHLEAKQGLNGEVAGIVVGNDINQEDSFSGSDKPVASTRDPFLYFLSQSEIEVETEEKRNDNEDNCVIDNKINKVSLDLENELYVVENGDDDQDDNDDDDDDNDHVDYDDNNHDDDNDHDDDGHRSEEHSGKQETTNEASYQEIYILSPIPEDPGEDQTSELIELEQMRSPRRETVRQSKTPQTMRPSLKIRRRERYKSFTSLSDDSDDNVKQDDIFHETLPESNLSQLCDTLNDETRKKHDAPSISGDESSEFIELEPMRTPRKESIRQSNPIIQTRPPSLEDVRTERNKSFSSLSEDCEDSNDEQKQDIIHETLPGPNLSQLCDTSNEETRRKHKTPSLSEATQTKRLKSATIVRGQWNDLKNDFFVKEPLIFSICGCSHICPILDDNN